MKIKKIILFFFVFLIFSIVAIVFANDSGLSNRRILTEKRSIEAYENIIHSFAVSEQGIQYHEHFAGAYLNQHGTLVVLVSALDPHEFQAAILDFERLSGVENPNHILFREALYSFAYLSGLMEQLNDAFFGDFSDPDSIWYEVTGFSLRENQNMIAVEILNLDDSKIERFRNEASDSGAIVLENSRRSNTAESLHPGMMANTGSIGFRARMGDVYGFVTAGHNASTGRQVIRRHRIGTCVISITDSRLDGAFVRTDTGVGEISNKTHTGREISGINKNPIHGATVFQEGRSTGLTVGNILSTNATHHYTINNGQLTITRSNLVIADYISAMNDSGGIVYDIKGRVLGIHIAGPAHGGAGERIVEKATTIQNVLNVSVY
ncbi:MAG: S1 family peptidase [Clostridiales bacterium]|nr:S1 family peptidase [Clostridiales bacterium]